MMGRNAAPTGNEQQDSGRKGPGTLLGCKIMTSEPINKVRIGGYIDGVCNSASSWLWKSAWMNVRTNFPKLCESRLCIALNDVHSSRRSMKYESAGKAL